MPFLVNRSYCLTRGPKASSWLIGVSEWDARLVFGPPIGQWEVRLASWRLPYSEPEILANRRDQIRHPMALVCKPPVVSKVCSQAAARPAGPAAQPSPSPWVWDPNYNKYRRWNGPSGSGSKLGRIVSTLFLLWSS